MYFQLRQYRKMQQEKVKDLASTAILPAKTVYLKLLEHIKNIQDTADFMTLACIFIFSLITMILDFGKQY